MSVVLFLISHILFQEELQNPYLELRLLSGYCKNFG
jgi:hypothetical protein